MMSRFDRLLKKPIPGKGLFCECVSDSCRKRLSISYDRYRQLKHQGRVILVEHLKKSEKPILTEDGWALVLFTIAHRDKVGRSLSIRSDDGN